MRNHYLPKFLLNGFRDQDGLWQFDIRTGNFERRNIDKAGARLHFYTVELETGLLQRIDGEAAAVFAKGLVGPKGEILITCADREKLARWLALFAIRTPQTFEDFKVHVEEASKNPQQAIDILYENRDRVFETIRESNPGLYEMLSEELGPSLAEEVILAASASLVHQKHANYVPDPKSAFVDYINEDRMRRFAARLLRFQWLWLWSEYGFVIGDNPLCRWSKRNSRWNYGLNHRDIEITIPLSQHICLRLQRRQSRAKIALHCNREQTITYNRRQRVSAVYNVYGCQRRLRPMAVKVVANLVATGRMPAPPRHAP